MAWIRGIIFAGALLVLPGGACLAGAQPAASAARGPASLPAAAAASSSAYAGLPLQREDGPGASGGMSWGLQLVLAGALVAMLAGVYRLRRRQMAAARPGTALQSLQALRLAQGVSLHAVQWGDEQVLLACTAAGVTVVSRRSSVSGNEPEQRSGAA